MSELLPSLAKPLAGVPIFLCRIPAVAAGDRDRVNDFLLRLGWIPSFGCTVFRCAHHPPCALPTAEEWQAVVRLSPAAEQFVARFRA